MNPRENLARAIAVKAAAQKQLDHVIGVADRAAAIAEQSAAAAHEAKKAVAAAAADAARRFVSSLHADTAADAQAMEQDVQVVRARVRLLAAETKADTAKDAAGLLRREVEAARAQLNEAGEAVHAAIAAVIAIDAEQAAAQLKAARATVLRCESFLRALAKLPLERHAAPFRLAVLSAFESPPGFPHEMDPESRALRRLRSYYNALHADVGAEFANIADPKPAPVQPVPAPYVERVQQMQPVPAIAVLRAA